MTRKAYIVVAAFLSLSNAQAKDWVYDKAQCQYESMLRDRLAIEDGKIYGLEMECDILKSQLKDGYTYADVSCNAEGQQDTATVRFKIDEKGLHYKRGKGQELLFPYACP